jgi:5-methylcytosine-specific restriction endonuclease McrA
MRTHPEQRAKKKERGKVWVAANRDKCRAKVSRYRERHPDRVKSYKKKYAAENAEAIAASTRRYHQANPNKCRAWWKAKHDRIKASKELHEKRKAMHRDYYRRNAEMCKAKVQAYAKAHPEKARLWSRITAARRRTKLVGFCLAEQWRARIEYYGWTCAYCHKELDLYTVQRDHVKPIFAGGADWASNSVPCCGTCNTRKGTKRWIPRPVWQTKET